MPSKRANKEKINDDELDRVVEDLLVGGYEEAGVKRKLVVDDRGLNKTSNRAEAMKKTRAMATEFWTLKAEEKKKEYEEAGGNPKVIAYINNLLYRYIKKTFYYLLETLDKQQIIKIIKRENKGKYSGHPLEFKILNSSGCNGKFDDFFVKKDESSNIHIDHPEALVQPRDEITIIKNTADNMWKNVLYWFITSEEKATKFDQGMLLKNDTRQELIDVKGLLGVPYPFCFTDVDAQERVFKFVDLPVKIPPVAICNGLEQKMYIQQLLLMKSLDPEMFTPAPSLSALEAGLSAYDPTTPSLASLQPGLMASRAVSLAAVLSRHNYGPPLSYSEALLSDLKN